MTNYPKTREKGGNKGEKRKGEKNKGGGSKSG